MSVVQFPATRGRRPPDGAGQDIANAVDRYLDSIQAATTRAGYAETLARLTAIAGSREAGTLQPEDYAAVMARSGRSHGGHLEPAPVRARLLHRLARRNEILAANPARRLERRKPARHGDRSVRAPGSRSCSADGTGTACASESCGGCSTRPPAPAKRSSPSTSKTSTWSSGEPASPPRAVPSSTSTGPPARPVSCPGCYAAAPPAWSSWPTSARPVSGRRAPAAKDICPATGQAVLSAR